MSKAEDAKAEMQKAQVVNQRHPLTLACGRFLQATVENNENMNRVPHEDLKSFEDEDPSSIRPEIYVKRIVRYGGCSPSTLALGLLYVERLKRKLLKVWLTPRNVQRLYLVAVLEAVKTWEDFYYSNEHWAKIGGVTLQELNSLELQFLQLMGWEMYVSTEEYDAFSASILEWRPLPKASAPAKKTDKPTIDMSYIPRCLLDGRNSAPCASFSSDSAHVSSPQGSGPATPSSSSSSERSQASTPRCLESADLDGSPSESAAKSKRGTVRLWGQVLNVLSSA